MVTKCISNQLVRSNFQNNQTKKTDVSVDASIWGASRSYLALGEGSDCVRHTVCKQPVKLCGPYYIVLSPLYRVLYGNKITELPKGLFDGLVSLQLL